MTLVMAARLIQSVLHPSTLSETKNRRSRERETNGSSLPIISVCPQSSGCVILHGSSLQPPSAGCSPWKMHSILQKQSTSKKKKSHYLEGRCGYTLGPEVLCTTRQTSLLSFWYPSILSHGSFGQSNALQNIPLRGLNEPFFTRCHTNTA